jgi:hypothetical protein
VGALLFSEGPRRWNWKAIATPAIALGFAGLFMVPWMLLLYRSSQSFLYPFMRGTQQAGFNSAGLGWVQTVAFCGRFLLHPGVLLLGGMSLAAAALLPNRLSAVFTAAAIVTSAAICLSFTNSDPQNLYRYAHPVLFAALMVSCSRLFGAAWQRTNRRRRLISLCLLGPLLPFLGMAWSVGGLERAAAFRSLPLQVSGQRPFASASELQNYRMLQASIAPGARLYAILDKPSLLDYSVARIYNADIPGACSLPPGMPFFHGPIPFKKYLRSLGIEYIAYTDFEVALPLYNRSNWRENLNSPKAIWRFLAPYYLDLMDNVERLARSGNSVTVFGAERLIHLD